MIWGTRYRDPAPLDPRAAAYEAVRDEWTTAAVAHNAAKQAGDEAEACKQWLELQRLLDQALDLGRP